MIGLEDLHIFGEACSLFVFYRYRNVPTFGRSTIRRFRKKVSELKQMAARDFEDLLRVRCILCKLRRLL